MFDLLVSPFFDSQGGQIKVRFGGTLRVRPTVMLLLALIALTLLTYVRILQQVDPAVTYVSAIPMMRYFLIAHPEVATLKELFLLKSWALI